MKPSVSIVIPAYNAALTIAGTIRAALAQDYGIASSEIVVVDDGSRDATGEIARRFDIRYIRQENAGPAAARNAGWRAATGDIILFTDADCIPPSDWVSRHIAHFDSPAIAAVGGSYGIANPRSFIARCVHEEIRYRHRRMSFRARVLGSLNLSIRRGVLEKQGGYDASYTMAAEEDTDFCYRMDKNGCALVFDKDIRVAHYHPDRLRGYLRTQFWHGYWRVKLYLHHPGMVGGDGYSGIFDYLQPCIACAVIALSPLVLCGPGRGLLAALLLAALLLAEGLMQMPVTVSIILRTGDLCYMALAGITFLRAFARAGGMLYGIARFIVMRTR